jgi:formate dehydrogenase gamma subunit
MKQTTPPLSPNSTPVKVEVHIQRFTLGQRWEHALLLLSTITLLLTGLPQRYRDASWSQYILSTPERVELVRQIHHIAALVLTVLVIYHLGRAIVMLARRKLPGAMLLTWQDLRDAWKMVKHLLFLSKEKPQYGKYNFEQKFTYWFIFFGIGIMIVSGFILWFPEIWTRILPGGIIPAARLAHSTEAVVAAAFIVIWHFFHVLIERLNLSMFTGWLSAEDMRTYHPLEYQRLGEDTTEKSETGDGQ